MKNVIYLLVCILMLSCDNQEKRNREGLIRAITECINTTDFQENILAVYKSPHDYGDYDIYLIQGFFGIIEGEKLPNEILKIKNKFIFFYTGENELAETVVRNIDEEFGGHDNISNTAYYYGQCKKTGKDRLFQLVNRDIKSYEIPELRDFSCSVDIDYQPDSIEIIADKYYVGAEENITVKQDTILHPKSLYVYVYVYNRTNSLMFFGNPEDSLGHFYILNGSDTLAFKAENIGIHNSYIDDPQYRDYPDKELGFRLKSEDSTFFHKFDMNDINKLIKDSLFYFPNINCHNLDKYKEYIYPTKVMKVVVPNDIIYSYITPNYFYTYYGNYDIEKKKRNKEKSSDTDTVIVNK